MAFNIWMWILLVLFIVGTIAVILILTVGSVLEERSYDRRSEDEKAQKFRKKILRCQRDIQMNRKSRATGKNK